MRIKLPLVILVLAVAGVARATTYVVAPTGSDSAAGTVGAPFRTVQRGLSSLRPGDTLTIRAGTYAESAVLVAGGRADAPILVQAEPGAVLTSPDSSGAAIGLDIASGVAFVRLAGIEAGDGFGVAMAMRAGTHDIDVSNCRLHGNRVGLTIAGGGAITVRGCSLYENRRAGLRIIDLAHDITVQDTDAFDNSDGLGCDGEGDGFVIDSDAVHDVVFQRTRAFRNSEDGYDLHGSALTLDQVQSLDQCGGMKLRDTTSVSNCVVAGNRSGIKTAALQRSTAFSIVHCTLLDNVFPIVLNAPTVPVRRYPVQLFNNIVIAPNWALEYDQSVQLSEGHNIFWRGDQQQILIKVLPGGGGYSGSDLNRGTWHQYTGQGEGTFSLDPALRNPAALDLIPQSDSAAVDRADAAHTTLVDILGTPRPQGRASDIGAYEVLSPSSNHRPQADAGASSRTVLSGRPALFDGSASFDVDGDPLSYTWNFGDGGSANGAVVYHTYVNAGQYAATLTVSDGGSSSVVTVPVTVLEWSRPPRPTRTRPVPPRSTPTPLPSNTPIPVPTGTPTAVPTSGVPSNVQLGVTMSSTGRAGSLVDISARYRNLAGSSTVRVGLPPELRAETVIPGGYDNSGGQLVWSDVTGASGAVKVKARVSASAVSGSQVRVVVTIVENATGRSVTQSASTVIQ